MEFSEYDALKLDNQVCFPLYAAAREVTKLYRPYLDALNLTYTQYIVQREEARREAVPRLGHAHARYQEP